LYASHRYTQHACPVKVFSNSSNSDADLSSLQEIAYSEKNQRYSDEDYQMIVVKAEFGEIKRYV